MPQPAVEMGVPAKPGGHCTTAADAVAARGGRPGWRAQAGAPPRRRHNGMRDLHGVPRAPPRRMPRR